MICAVTQKNKDRFLALSAESQMAGLRLETAFACYETHANVCRFYLAGDTAALMVAGGSLLCCGSLPDAEELASFSAFCGVQAVEGAPPLPGFLPQKRLALCRPAGAPVGMAADKEIEITLSPDLWRLKNAGLFADGDGFYADACLRQRHGAVIGAAGRGGDYFATAGFYAVRQDCAYLTGVATHPDHRGQGFAGAVVAALCRTASQKNIYLRCEESLLGFYERFGFSVVAIESDQIKKEDDTIE